MEQISGLSSALSWLPALKLQNPNFHRCAPICQRVFHYTVPSHPSVLKCDPQLEIGWRIESHFCKLFVLSSIVLGRDIYSVSNDHKQEIALQIASRWHKINCNAVRRSYITYLTWWISRCSSTAEDKLYKSFLFSSNNTSNKQQVLSSDK